MAKLKYLVLHCTATPEGREVTADDIRRWHTAPVAAGGRGWRQVGYTDLIHLDGTVERLVDNNEDANDDVPVLKREFYPYTSAGILGKEPVKTYTLEKNSRRFAQPILNSEIESSLGAIQQNTY